MNHQDPDSQIPNRLPPLKNGYEVPLKFTQPKPHTVAHLEVVVPATITLDELRHRFSGFAPWLETVIIDQDRKHDTRLTISVTAEPPAAAYLYTLTIPKESTP